MAGLASVFASPAQAAVGEDRAPALDEQRAVEEARTYKLNKDKFQPQVSPSMRRDIESSEDAAEFLKFYQMPEPRDFPLTTPEAREKMYRVRKPSLD